MIKKITIGIILSLISGSLFFHATAQETRIYKIFGPKYQNVTITSNVLKGAVYYLKSGHGGPDPGAMGKYQNHRLCEDEYAYDVILRLGRKLIENGATVYFIIKDPDDGIRDLEFLTPDKDEVCYPDQTIPLNQVERLQQRVRAINSLFEQNKGKFQRMISVHVDSRSKGENIDVFFYHNSESKKGEKTARNLKNIFKEKYRKHQPDRGYRGTVSTRDLYVLTHSRPVSVFIELGNIQHSLDQKRIIDPNNRQALAKWLAEGLMKDYRTNK
jgi:N-acetylmuramoyl-L-alanine amidase